VSGYCSAYAKAICAIGSTCQFETSTCETYQTTQCTTAASAAMDGTRQYTSTNVQACINALNGAYGGSPTSISASSLQGVATACNEVFVGTSALMGPCKNNYDCATSSQICASAPGQSAVCTTATPKLLGQACADPGDQCPAGAYCAPQSGTSTCVMAPAAGSACSSSEMCGSSGTCLNGVCQAVGQVGAICNTDADCSSGLFCDTYVEPPYIPSPVCSNALTFASGSKDCLGIDGQTATSPGTDAGTTTDGGGAVDSAADSHAADTGTVATEAGGG
jgi:Dickkopf N-terminal cysteine-rich region